MNSCTCPSVRKPSSWSARIADALPCHGPDVHVCSPPAVAPVDGGGDQQPPDPVAAATPVDDDGLDGRLGAVPEQPGEPDEVAAVDRDPGVDPVGQRQVVVEPGPGIVAADRGVVVDLPMVLDELCVQPATGVQVGRPVGAHLHARMVAGPAGICALASGGCFERMLWVRVDDRPIAGSTCSAAISAARTGWSPGGT